MHRIPGKNLTINPMTITQKLSKALEALRYYETESNYHLQPDGVSSVERDMGKLATETLQAILGEDYNQDRITHNQFIEKWVIAYENQQGISYKFNGGKDGKAVTSLLALKLTAEQLIEIAVEAWKRPLDFNCRQAVSIAGFSSRFNEIRAELKQPYGINGRHNAPNPRNVGTCETTTDFEAASRKLRGRRPVGEDVAQVRDETPAALADAAESLRLFKESL